MEGPTAPTEESVGSSATEMVDQTYEFSAPRWFDLINGETEDEGHRAELWFESPFSWGPPRGPSIVLTRSGLIANPARGKKKKRKRPQPTFVKIFSKEDELALLQGVYSFASIYGKDPSWHEEEFCSHVKPMLRCEVSNEQIMNKYGNVKRKFKHVSKIVKTGKCEEKQVDVCPQALELWKKIWGGNVLTYKLKKRTSSG